jgi:hypothetical protein
MHACLSPRTDHGASRRVATWTHIQNRGIVGWRLVPEHYDDDGLSGASLDRPALQTLLAEVRARRIDVVVVYKVDRLTRSLADFAKLIDLFDGTSTPPPAWGGSPSTSCCPSPSSNAR